MTYRNLGILPVLWLVGTWGGMGVVGTRRQIDWATRIWGRRGFGGIERQNFFGLVADLFRGEADLRVGWRQFFEEL